MLRGFELQGGDIGECQGFPGVGYMRSYELESDVEVDMPSAWVGVTETGTLNDGITYRELP